MSLSAWPSAYSSPGPVGRPDLDNGRGLARTSDQIADMRFGRLLGCGPGPRAAAPARACAAVAGLEPLELLDEEREIREVAWADCLSIRQVLTATPSTVCRTAERTCDPSARQQAGGVAEQSEPIVAPRSRADYRPARTRGGSGGPVELDRTGQPEIDELGPCGSSGSPTSSPSTWSARSLISWARHGVQAAGPAARASASVSSRSRLSTSARPSTASTRASSGGWIGVVAAGGELDQCEVLPDEQLDEIGSPSPVSPICCDQLPGDRSPDRRVVDSAVGALADVMEQAGQQQAGRVARPGSGRCWTSATVWIECRSTV